MDWQGIGRVSANTTLAACGAGLSAVILIYLRSKKWDLGISVNGFLGGLVAITCPCYWVSPFGAIMIGLVAGAVVIIGIDLLEHWRIDDPIGAWPVHGLAGIWGTLSLGLFAAGRYGVPTADGVDKSAIVKGLFYGGGTAQLKAQAIGSATCVVLVLGVTLIIMYAIKAIRGSWTLRLNKEGELEGMDIYEHGTPAYHMEFGQGVSYTTLLGSGRDLGTVDQATSAPVPANREPV
jgi:Amt family ammonium transporter